MRALCKPARSIAARIWVSFEGWANFTRTRVPPLKSTPKGMPCQKNIESTPATLKISEKARKYHFQPKKSMFVLRKNSTLLGFLNVRYSRPLLAACAREWRQKLPVKQRLR